MPRIPLAEIYKSRYPHQVRENPQPSNEGWMADIRPLPVFGNSLHGPDGIFSKRKMTSWARSYSNWIKSFLRGNWNLSTSQLSWAPNASTRNHSTAAPPSISSAVFVLLCLLWYSMSAISSNTGKAILVQFRYPITLTFVQFGFVAFYCLLFMTPVIRFSKLQAPSKAVISTTLPMGTFQVIGHVFSSIAISRIPVSTVHTIKALSPLFTVAAYALFFGVGYSSKTYFSLLPLTIGVMLACSFDTSASNLIGVLSAFGSAIVFVSQNIFFKKIMPSTHGTSSTRLDVSHRLDKLNLLLYSSSLAFLLMIPLWLYNDLPLFIAAAANPHHIKHPKSGHDTPHSVAYYFVMNGIVHFSQNIIAFVILSSTSPVTYSIASLIKRVAVICIAIIWFNQKVHPVQAFGIFMTFVGLHMYNQAKSDVDRGEKKMRRVAAERNLILPMTNPNPGSMAVYDRPPEYRVVETTGLGFNSAYPRTASSMLQHTLHPYAIPSQQPLNSHPPSKHFPKMSLRINSPMDSYPSPPPSIDSPTSGSIPLTDNLNSSLYENHQVYLDRNIS